MLLGVPPAEAAEAQSAAPARLIFDLSRFPEAEAAAPSGGKIKEASHYKAFDSPQRASPIKGMKSIPF